MKWQNGKHILYYRGKILRDEYSLIKHSEYSFTQSSIKSVKLHNFQDVSKVRKKTHKCFNGSKVNRFNNIDQANSLHTRYSWWYRVLAKLQCTHDSNGARDNTGVKACLIVFLYPRDFVLCFFFRDFNWGKGGIKKLFSGVYHAQ